MSVMIEIVIYCCQSIISLLYVSLFPFQHELDKSSVSLCQLFYFSGCFSHVLPWTSQQRCNYWWSLVPDNFTIFPSPTSWKLYYWISSLILGHEWSIRKNTEVYRSIPKYTEVPSLNRWLSHKVYKWATKRGVCDGHEWTNCSVACRRLPVESTSFGGITT